jgi:hypothetical protein
MDWIHPLALFAHSWLRWLVLGVGVAVAVRAARGHSHGRDFSEEDEQLARAWVGLVDTQLLLGLTLYALSPLTHAAFAAPRAAFWESTLRFPWIEPVRHAERGRRAARRPGARAPLGSQARATARCWSPRFSPRCCSRSASPWRGLPRAAAHPLRRSPA